MRQSKPSIPQFDVVFTGDMAGCLDHCLRIAGGAAAADAAGYRTGLLHLPASGEDVPVSPELRACLRNTSIVILEPQQKAATKLLVAHPPCDGAALGQVLAALDARRIVAVPGDAGISLAGLENAILKTLSVAPTTALMREGLLAGPKLRLEARNWLPVSSGWAPRQPKRSTTVALGAVIPAGWPQAVNLIREAVTGHAELLPHVWRDRGEGRQMPAIPEDWKSFDGAEISFDWFLRRIDVLLLAGPAEKGVPEAIAAAALAAGKLVAAPPSLKHLLPAEVVTAEPNDIPAAISAALGEADGVLRRKKRAAFGTLPDEFAARLAALGKISRARKRNGRRAAAGRKPRVLFVPKGGVGLGHVARLAAIARKAGGAFDPVFVSLSESAGLIEALGFRTEYIPSAAYADASAPVWEPWFQQELEQLIDAYDAQAVVFDGSDPPAALTRAVASRGWCRGVWVRRGMWAPGYDPSLQRSSSYDLIIEPGEIAAGRDRGATAARRHETLAVEPITLLDPHDLLSRGKAAAAIGFDPERPAVLLQLGSGENRDVLGLAAEAVAACRRFPGLQIAIAEWANAAGSLSLWPDVTVLKGAPLSLYFRAFDFSIGAAGYNGFHEAMNFGLPSILVPNRAPGMDDQEGRAAFAQDAGAAIVLHEHEFGELPDILSLMMRPEFRCVMRGNCAALARGNGAGSAARMIAELVS